MAKRGPDKDQDLDPAGDHGGDTGTSSFPPHSYPAPLDVVL